MRAAFPALRGVILREGKRAHFTGDTDDWEERWRSIARKMFGRADLVVEFEFTHNSGTG